LPFHFSYAPSALLRRYSLSNPLPMFLVVQFRGPNLVACGQTN